MKSFLFFLLASASAATLDFALIEDSMDQLISVHSSPCTYQALSEYLDKCTEVGFDLVDPQLRLRLAVKLSLCEFLEAGVEYPEQCRKTETNDDIHRCIQSFRAVAQLWTTYSGNYRKIRSLCYEESFPHTKAHILDVFANITRVYSSFYESVEKSFSEVKKNQLDISLRFESLLLLVDSAITTKRAELSDLDTEAGTLRAQFQLFLGEMASVFRRSEKEALELQEELDSAREHASQLSRAIQGIGQDAETTGSELVSAREVEKQQFLFDLREMAAFVGETSHFARALMAHLQQMLVHSQAQREALEKNSNSLEALAGSISGLLDIAEGFQAAFLESTSAARAELDVLRHDAGASRRAVEEFFAQALAETANITTRIHSISQHVSALPLLGVGDLLRTVARWVRQTFIVSTAAIFAVTIITVCLRFKVFSRFFSGVFPGVAAGFLLRFFWSLI